eukprot:Skav219601  [mRNA]  locus=scaffold1719:364083:379560:- [translate_table: standard]
MQQPVLQEVEKGGGPTPAATANAHAAPSGPPSAAVQTWLGKFFAAGLPKRLSENLIRMELEARNDVVSVLSHVVRIAPLVELDLTYDMAPEFFESLIATHCGLMLRSCAREEKLVRGFLAHNELILELMKFTRHEEFEISTDAFASLHDLLLKHHDISAEYLQGNFRPFFTSYNKLLEDGDYVTKRQAGCSRGNIGDGGGMGSFSPNKKITKALEAPVRTNAAGYQAGQAAEAVSPKSVKSQEAL